MEHHTIFTRFGGAGGLLNRVSRGSHRNVKLSKVLAFPELTYLPLLQVGGWIRLT